MRSIPLLGSPATRRNDARTSIVLMLLFSVLALPWSLPLFRSSTLWINSTGIAVTGAVTMLLLLHRMVAPPAWVLTSITLTNGTTAALLAIGMQAPTLAAAICLCVVLQVSCLRTRREAWMQLTVMALTFVLTALLVSASAHELIVMAPVLVTLVLLTAVVTRMRSHLDELLVLLHHRADHDPLTGLLNRQGLSRHLQSIPGAQAQAAVETAVEVDPDAAERAGNRKALRVPADALGVLVIDVDHFKAVNDRHGHLAGDEALVWLAGLLREALPAPALLARFGGEEFLAMLPRCILEELVGRAEHVRALVATTSTSRTVALTVSIGAAVGTAGIGFEELFARADQGMYAAKRAGRNRVEVHPPGSPPSKPGGVED